MTTDTLLALQALVNAAVVARAHMAVAKSRSAYMPYADQLAIEQASEDADARLYAFASPRINELRPHTVSYVSEPIPY